MLECLATALKSNGVQPGYVIFTTYAERQDGGTSIGKLLYSIRSFYAFITSNSFFSI